MLLGAHLSIAGGVHKAVELADGYGFNALAMPLILETPKGLTDDGQDWDKVNAQRRTP